MTINGVTAEFGTPNSVVTPDGNSLPRFSVPNPERSKIRSRVGERALGQGFDESFTPDYNGVRRASSG